MKRLLLPLLVALALPTAVNGERKNGWKHIFTNNNDEMLYIKILDPKSNKRYRSFETKLYTYEEVIQKTRKIDCKEKRIYFPSKFKWISTSQNSLTTKMYKEVCKPETNFKPYKSATENNTSDTTLDAPNYMNEVCRTIYNNPDIDFFDGIDESVRESFKKECAE
tara:strand:- start:604 stop:1098 length:495 start_codon:yes stop_codon:yes gene_type:complete